MSTNFSSDHTPATPQYEHESPPKKFKWKNIDFSYLLSKDFILIFLLGQLLALCITTTIVANTNLQILFPGFNIPTTLSLFLYITLAIIYTPISIFKYGFGGYFKMLKGRWWKYFLLGLVDVEGNYFVNKGYVYTNPFSMALLDAWATPVVVVLSLIFLKVRYHPTQYIGVIICLAGLGLVAYCDFQDENNTAAGSDPIKGDLFALLGATFYSISNVYEEYCVRKRSLHEVLGQLGFWGMVVSFIQIGAAERGEWQQLGSDSRMIVGLIIYYINPATKPNIKPDYEDDKHGGVNENGRDLESSYGVNNENDDEKR
ncbi:38626_t:CDS:2, partial [Gigaspora margarita]